MKWSVFTGGMLKAARLACSSTGLQIREPGQALDTGLFCVLLGTRAEPQALRWQVTYLIMVSDGNSEELRVLVFRCLFHMALCDTLSHGSVILLYLRKGQGPELWSSFWLSLSMSRRSC